MSRSWFAALLAPGFIGVASPPPAQTFAVEDPVLRRIWTEGMENSQAARLAQALLDSIGPRLTGSPGQKAAYPTPKRTILVGHWSGEEQGLNGSRAWVTDHPEVLEGLQALFNQDNGTGRVTNISMQGLLEAGSFFGRWFARLPSEITQHITLRIPGTPGGGGSDYASFICSGAHGAAGVSGVGRARAPAARPSNGELLGVTPSQIREGGGLRFAAERFRDGLQKWRGQAAS